VREESDLNEGVSKVLSGRGMRLDKKSGTSAKLKKLAECEYYEVLKCKTLC